MALYNELAKLYTEYGKDLHPETKSFVANTIIGSVSTEGSEGLANAVMPPRRPELHARIFHDGPDTDFKTAEQLKTEAAIAAQQQVLAMQQVQVNRVYGHGWLRPTSIAPEKTKYSPPPSFKLTHKTSPMFGKSMFGIWYNWRTDFPGHKAFVRWILRISRKK